MVLAMATEQSGEDKAARLRVGVIAGSTRPGRQSKTVAEWVCADPIPSLDLRLIDLADIGLLSVGSAIAGRLSAAPGCGPGCPRDRGMRSRESRTAARSAPGRPRLRRPAPSRRCR